MSKIVEVSGYDPFGSQEEVDVLVHIHGKPQFFTGEDWEGQWRAWLDNQAELVTEAIMNSLPQGVSWLVLIKMMQKHLQLYARNDLAK